MTISGGKNGALWTGGSVVLVLLAILLGRVFMGQEDEHTPVQFRDSAGVEVVESFRPAWEEGEAWRVSLEERLRIGVVEGDPAYQFSGITGVCRIRDGTIVVADEGSQEVRFYDSLGAIRAVAGGRGGGPGEFTGLSGLGPAPSGGVWAYEFSLRRVTWMTASGEITRLTRLDPEPPILNALGALWDGSFVLKQLWGQAAPTSTVQEGLRRDPLVFVRYSEDGALVDTIARVPGRELHISFDETGRGVMGTPPFGRNAVGVVAGEALIVGTQADFSLRELDPQGRLQRILRIPGKVRQVGASDLEAYIQGRLAAASSQEHARIRRSLEAMPHPETLPAYGGLLVDREGNLWVGEWAMAPETPSRWFVFDPEGRWLGEVRVPDGFHPWDVGSHWILGTERDVLDVEYVVLYSVVKES